MRDCADFEKKLLRGIPYRFRNDAEHILGAFQGSRIMLTVFRRAIESVAKPDVGSPEAPYVISFGSFGRLDGSSFLSDYDTLFIYPGGKKPARVKAIEGMIKDLVTQNAALLFDHRAEIEAGSFEFSSSPAYPILSINELLSDKQVVRAMQLLTEGRIIRGEKTMNDLRMKLAESLGYVNNEHTLDISNLHKQLEGLKNSYCTEVMDRLIGSTRPLRNRKILKLFALREIFYISTLFATAEVALGVSGNCCSSREAVQKLSAPPILKLASFADATAPLPTIVNAMAPSLQDAISQAVAKRIEELSDDAKITVIEEKNLPGESKFLGQIRALSLATLKPYNSLMRNLHDVKFNEYIDNREPDVMTWLGRIQFTNILDSRKAVIDTSKVFAKALLDVLELLEQNHSNAALHQARISFQEIINYKLLLKLDG